MPPPSIPLRGPNRFQLHFLSVYTSIELSSSILIVCLSFYCTENWSSLDSGRSESGDKTIDDDRSLERKLETPLAAMLPSKYANVDVRDLFPDFRPDKVLRFSRLFGPGKPTSLPQIWRSVRRKRRKRKHSRESGKVCWFRTLKPLRRVSSGHFYWIYSMRVRILPAKRMKSFRSGKIGDLHRCRMHQFRHPIKLSPTMNIDYCVKCPTMQEVCVCVCVALWPWIVRSNEMITTHFCWLLLICNR